MMAARDIHQPGASGHHEIGSGRWISRSSRVPGFNASGIGAGGLVAVLVAGLVAGSFITLNFYITVNAILRRTKLLFFGYSHTQPFIEPVYVIICSRHLYQVDTMLPAEGL